ncbi:MAG: flagellar biosynthetic protein FliR [Acidobacteriaceae bacterium]|nr:flagellar biosynthetic protein FliR [Acidobacteriaceae bacterium]
MPISVHFGTEAIAGFLLTLTRVGAALFFLPLPGFAEAARTARIVLVVGITFCLVPVWPVLRMDGLGAGQFTLALLGESGAGLLIGLAISFLHETFQFAAQAVSMQSGFSIASVFDPASKADTTVFQVITQLTTGLLFFVFGVHQQLIRILGRSFEIFTPNWAVLERASLKAIIILGGTMFTTGLKLALPLVVLLFLVELSLALLGRLHAQLQLMMVSFPAKTALSFLFLGAMMVRWPALYEHLARMVFDTLARLAPA